MGDRPGRIGFLGTYPPKECGIATFTRDLVEAIGHSDPSVRVIVAASDGDPRAYHAPVEWILRPTDPDSYVRTAAFFNAARVDLVCLQHEFGIFGGVECTRLCRFLDALRAPLVTTLHTVLPRPPATARRMVQTLAASSGALVVMNALATDLLESAYGIDRERVHLIHHGAPALDRWAAVGAKERLGLGGRTVVSTFGFLNPDKGIDDALRAFSRLTDRWVAPRASGALPRPAGPSTLVREDGGARLRGWRWSNLRYLVLGQTHPEIRRRSGESYRRSLELLADELGIGDRVVFVNRYLSQEELLEYLMATDIYLSPYLNPDQITSGTLAYAVALGKAVVSTPYLYAQFLLSHGRGVLVDFRDPEGLAEALDRLLDDPEELARLGRAAREYGSQMAWPAVARDYLRLFGQITAGRRDEIEASAAVATL